MILDICVNKPLSLVPAIYRNYFMTNKSSSKQHGLSTVSIQQPKSKLRARRNKAKANIRKDERRNLAKSEK